MGLDQYLTKKTYVKNWGHMSDSELHNVIVVGNASKQIKPERISHIEEEIWTWRKANQIHNWFVNNVQSGLDNCTSHFVVADKLEELSNLCKEVIADHSKAEDLLPSVSGFFFGDTEYDEWYFKTLAETAKMIDSILIEMTDNGVDYEFYYQSSW